MGEIEPGAVFECAYPFVRSWNYQPEGSWKPGVRYVGSELDEDAEVIHDGIGARIATVVSVHRPGKYPTRVFFIREWRGPDGAVFGNRRLRIQPVSIFLRQSRGFPHESRQATAEEMAQAAATNA